MAEMEDVAISSFINRMVEHLNNFFSDRCNIIGEKDLRKLIRSGIDKAISYNIVKESDVAKFIDLMLALHPDFDSDPQMPWMHKILSDSELTSDAKLNMLIHQISLKTKAGSLNED